MRDGGQNGVVIGAAADDDGRDRENDAGRRVGVAGQSGMDEEAMHASVAVLERVDVDEAEGDAGGQDDGIGERIPWIT